GERGGDGHRASVTARRARLTRAGCAGRREPGGADACDGTGAGFPVPAAAAPGAAGRAPGPARPPERAAGRAAVRPRRTVPARRVREGTAEPTRARWQRQSSPPQLLPARREAPTNRRPRLLPAAAETPMGRDSPARRPAAERGAERAR